MLYKVIKISFRIIILNTIILYHLTICEVDGSLISDAELLNISEELFNKSVNVFYKHLCIKYQGQITSKNFTDNAPERLLNVSFNDVTTKTTDSLIKLFDNYELNTYQSEIITIEKNAEEDEFINNLMETNVMLHTMYYLSVKGFFINDLKVYKNVLKEIWFHPYSRSKRINSSSGFEHVFVGESKRRKGIIGVHNWIFFYFGELTSKINYFGYSRRKEFPNGAAILEIYFTYNGRRKISTMFIGTPPELEIALYTLCFFTRPNKTCKISFIGSKFGIQTYVLKNDNKRYVGTAFPVI
ncbi:endoribonuclease Arlr [Nomia melanderi]|uniref:endoribonuclease Arlr n=1 Tax=Nomia melanderi TaxID=2448451 RepID=UPI0013044BE9|nr:poly(U)-specific endoribonuclease homolog [Nomia melanderi]